MSAADVGQLGRRRPTGHQADVGRRHFFFQFADTHTNVVRRRRPECRRVSASVVRRHCWSSFPTLTLMSADDTRRHSQRPANVSVSLADVGVSVGKLDRQCRRPTLADTQADTQSVTLVKAFTHSLPTILYMRGTLTV